MPSKGGRVCGHCNQVHQPGERCPLTKAMDDERKARFDKTRPSARQRGYDTKWQKESKAFLAMPRNRLCACGCGRAANMVDHRIAHKGSQTLFWDRANWQPMNSHCHNTKKQSAEKRQARTGGHQ